MPLEIKINLNLEKKSFVIMEISHITRNDEMFK